MQRALGGNAFGFYGQSREQVKCVGEKIFPINCLLMI
jgi:hypothetical protein